MKFAFDKKTVRRKDDNGFLHVAVSPISKETINPYLGSEIPGWKELGLDPDKSYNCYRPGEELEKAAPTFNGLPVLMGHLPESAEEPNKDERIGSMGTDAEYKEPYLNNSLTFTDQDAIDAIESGKIKELSSSYRWTPVIEKGTFNGESYDIRMTDIKGNHLGLVEEGRAGSDVLVHDQKFKGGKMPSKFLAALKKMLSSDSKEEDIEEAEKELVGEFKDKFDKLHDGESNMGAMDKIKKALDEMTEDEQKEAMDGMEEMLKAKKEKEDGANDMDPDPNAEDMSEEEIAKKKAEDEEKKKADDMEAEEKAKDQKADDAKNLKAEMKSEMQDINKAGREVLQVVGDVDALSFDSADKVYREALKLQGVNIETIPTGQAKTAFRMKRDSEDETVLANDSTKDTKELKGCFAGLNRQRRY